MNENIAQLISITTFCNGKAWCFGVQGSWNDMNFKDKLSTERYLKLTATLYDEIINGILAITNK